MKVVVLLAVMLSVVSGCQSKVPDLKSPCVGIENSPCGDRTSVNDNWMKS